MAIESDDELYLRLLPIYQGAEKQLKDRFFAVFYPVYKNGRGKKGEALKAAIAKHGHLPAEPLSAMQLAALEYEEALAAQDLMGI